VTPPEGDDMVALISKTYQDYELFTATAEPK